MEAHDYFSLGIHGVHRSLKTILDQSVEDSVPQA